MGLNSFLLPRLMVHGSKLQSVSDLLDIIIIMMPESLQNQTSHLPPAKDKSIRDSDQIFHDSQVHEPLTNQANDNRQLAKKIKKLENLLSQSEKNNESLKTQANAHKRNLEIQITKNKRSEELIKKFAERLTALSRLCPQHPLENTIDSVSYGAFTAALPSNSQKLLDNSADLSRQQSAGYIQSLNMTVGQRNNLINGSFQNSDGFRYEDEGDFDFDVDNEVLSYLDVITVKMESMQKANQASNTKLTKKTKELEELRSSLNLLKNELMEARVQVSEVKQLLAVAEKEKNQVLSEILKASNGIEDISKLDKNGLIVRYRQLVYRIRDLEEEKKAMAANHEKERNEEMKKYAKILNQLRGMRGGGGNSLSQSQL